MCHNKQEIQSAYLVPNIPAVTILRISQMQKGRHENVCPDGGEERVGGGDEICVIEEHVWLLCVTCF